MELVVKSKPKIVGPEVLIVNGEVKNIIDMIEDSAEYIKGEVVEAKFNVHVRGTIPTPILRVFLQRFFSWRVLKIDMSWTVYLKRETMKCKGKLLKGKTYDIRRELGWGEFSQDVKDLVVNTHPTFGNLWQELSSIPTRDGTAFDYVRSITIVKVYKRKTYGRHSHVVTLGCRGDCQPYLQFSTHAQIYQDFIDFFSLIKNVQVKAGICVEVRQPEEKDVVIVEEKTQKRPTGKMITASRCF